jgi:hypothetical protein
MATRFGVSNTPLGEVVAIHVRTPGTCCGKRHGYYRELGVKHEMRCCADYINGGSVGSI